MDFIRDETIKKLILLFVLDKMEIPLTEESIMEICTNRNEWLRYMDCKEAFNQLIAVKYIEKVKTEDPDIEPRDYMYTITTEGRNCLAHFYTRIRQHTREEITSFADVNRMVFKRNQEYVYEYFKNKDGSHTLVLKIRDPKAAQPLFEIRVKTMSRTTAINACKKWYQNAAQVYEFVFDRLLFEPAKKEEEKKKEETNSSSTPAKDATNN